jgi:hypothetical protein
MSTSRRIRVTWLVIGSVFAVALLSFGSLQVAVALAHEEHTEVHTFPASSVSTINVQSDGGAVRIVASQSDTVRVEAKVSDGLRSTGHSERLVGDELQLHASCPAMLSNFCGVDYTVSAPRDVSVMIHANDSVRVTGVVGAIDATTDNSDIHVLHAAGPLRLHSDNGSVDATDVRSQTFDASSDNGSVEATFTVAPTSVRAVSDNGSVTVVVPQDNAAYRVNAHSDNGSDSTPIRTDPASGRTITARSNNGDVTVRYPGG